MILNSSALVLSDDEENLPVIGADNIVTTSNVSADTADADFPVTNLANPATDLRWQGASTVDQSITVTTGTDEIDYLAIAKHNLGSAFVGVTVDAYPVETYTTKSHLHFHGPDASTTFTDETGKVWTAAGNAQIDTAEYKFRGSSGKFDGTGDYITTPGVADYNQGSSPWTIELWIKVNAADAAAVYVCGQVDAAGGADTNSSWFLVREAGNVLQLYLVSGATFAGGQVATTATFKASDGWRHFAAVRSGNVVSLYVDGVADNTLSYSSTINASTATLGIGRLGDYTSAPLFNGWVGEFKFVIGEALYTAAFTKPTAPGGLVSVAIGDDDYPTLDAYDKVMLHFDGADNSTAIRDDAQSGYAWTAANGAVIDTGTDDAPAAYFPFTADNKITRPDASDVTLGSSDFTIECWFNYNLPTVGFPGIAGQGDSTFTAANSAWVLLLIPGGLVRFNWCVGAAAFALDGTTEFTSVVNPGWHHVAAVRSGTTLTLYVDGIAEATTTEASAINNSASVLTIGGISGFSGLEWSGWIDRFRMRIGAALYTADFTPPPRETRLPADDGPLLFRFTPGTYSRVRLQLAGGDDEPRISVMYVGKLLELERSIKVDVDHTPITMGKVSKVAAGWSESGQFLGRIVLTQKNESAADFSYFTPSWYRTYFQPFVDAAVENPFFFAWQPAEYPLEVGYVSLLSDPVPGVDPVTQRVKVQLKYQGIV